MPRGLGGSQTWLFKGKYKAKQGFERSGRFKSENLPWEVWIFSGTTHMHHIMLLSYRQSFDLFLTSWQLSDGVCLIWPIRRLVCKILRWHDNAHQTGIFFFTVALFTALQQLWKLIWLVKLIRMHSESWQ